MQWLTSSLNQYAPHLIQGLWHLLMDSRCSMLMMVTCVSKADCDLGKVAQKGVSPLPPAESTVPSKEILPHWNDRPEYASLPTLPF